MTLFRSLDSAPRRLLLLDVGPAVAQCAFFCVEKSGVEGIVIKVCTTMSLNEGLHEIDTGRGVCEHNLPDLPCTHTSAA